MTPVTYWLEKLAEEMSAGRAEHGRFRSLPDAYGRLMFEWRELTDELHAFNPHADEPEQWDAITLESLQVAAMAMRLILELAPGGSVVPVPGGDDSA